MDFPLIFKICVNPGFNETVVYEAGYDNIGMYFLGRSRFNYSKVGWAGHTNTLGVQGSVAEVLSRIRQHTAGDVFKKMFLQSVDGQRFEISLDHAFSGQINYPHNCYTLDLTTNNDVKENDIDTIFINFHDMKNFIVDVTLLDKSLSWNRDANSFFSTGHIVRMERGVAVAFKVQIKKNVFVEEDKAKNCQVYPNADYFSYNDCDDQWMKDYVDQHIPGLVPIWLADDLETTTTHMSTDNGEITPDYHALS
jgi:hypothetical protein